MHARVRRISNKTIRIDLKLNGACDNAAVSHMTRDENIGCILRGLNVFSSRHNSRSAGKTLSLWAVIAWIPLFVLFQVVSVMRILCVHVRARRRLLDGLLVIGLKYEPKTNFINISSTLCY